MNRSSEEKRKPIWMAFIGAVLWMTSGSVLGQATPGCPAATIPCVLGDYEVFRFLDSKHENAHIIVMRTERQGTQDELETYGLAFVSNKTGPSGSPRGDGMICNDATLFLNDSAATCTKVVRNPAGKIMFEETLTVGVSGSHYCKALKSSLGAPGSVIVEDTDPSCTASGIRCICYEIHHRGEQPSQLRAEPEAEAPPSPGAGSGRGD